ncbi:hypothetical protein BDF22DRAFT_775445 [Syncephalis plumigaleata]|nr:hypothetical protein BDF22DRAFT_775445 [Syncephalis plumigaleata]
MQKLAQSEELVLHMIVHKRRQHDNYCGAYANAVTAGEADDALKKIEEECRRFAVKMLMAADSVDDS